MSETNRETVKLNSTKHLQSLELNVGKFGLIYIGQAAYGAASAIGLLRDAGCVTIDADENTQKRWPFLKTNPENKENP